MPQIEVVTRDGAPERPAAPARSLWAYLAWFVAAFTLIAAPASLWNFSRPPLYRATATVLTIVPEARSGSGAAVADAQHVAIQRSMLLGRSLLEDTLARLRDTVRGDTNPGNAERLADIAALTPDDLLSMLEVSLVPQTNLVELSATGAEPALLATLVNQWLAAYRALREREIATQVGDRLDKLDERARLLAERTRAKRAMLDDFRTRFDIVTLERDSNDALKRLDLLQEALGEAEGAARTARERLDTLEGAATIDQRALPEPFANELSDLHRRAAQARARARELRERYTELFIQKDPNKRRIVERLDALEARIDEVERAGRQQALAMAREDLDRASERVLELRRALTEQKARASRFSSGFAEFEALQQDLASLEEMQREVESQRTRLQTTSLASYPQIEIIEPAFAPRAPISPDYGRDLGLTLAAAGAVGLVTLIVLMWLDAKARGSRPPLPVTGVRIWGSETNDQADAQSAAAGARLPRRAGHSGELGAPGSRSADLSDAAGSEAPGVPGADASSPEPSVTHAPAPAPRPLMIGEVEALWQLADVTERQLIGLLLCGVQLDEAAALTHDRFALADGDLHLGTRVLKLPPRLRALFADADPLPAWAGFDRAAFEDLTHRLSLLAADAGIAHASEVQAATLRDTYLMYLVRQGARLTRLSQVAGPMSGAETLRFAPYSPAGAARSLDELDLTYPILA
ncbi:MAG: GumC family protein [Halochromatium sp.]